MYCEAMVEQKSATWWQQWNFWSNFLNCLITVQKITSSSVMPLFIFTLNRQISAGLWGTRSKPPPWALHLRGLCAHADKKFKRPVEKEYKRKLTYRCLVTI